MNTFNRRGNVRFQQFRMPGDGEVENELIEAAFFEGRQFVKEGAVVFRPEDQGCGGFRFEGDVIGLPVEGVGHVHSALGDFPEEPVTVECRDIGPPGGGNYSDFFGNLFRRV